jgi:uncharacterized protein YhaN
MRFESLTIEKYGLLDSRTLTFPASPGLVVIYGPNEAGKSTSLEAITDFLFGVQERTPRGQVFGNDSIRLSAALALADGSRLSLKRRKGRGRTLIDPAGQAVEDAVLTRFLGSTGRDRFGSLFGLDHVSLRSGGEHLLAADGDIGRLILEAGGGLRGLVEIIDELGAQAASLFDTRRKSDRRFYIGLDAFEAADKAVRDGLMTREAFDQARQRCAAAQETLDTLRAGERAITEETLRLDRLVRVVPTIRERDRLVEDLAAFSDLQALPDGFAEVCETALKSFETAELSLREADGRCGALQARIDALISPVGLLEVEAAIRDAGEAAIHVGKAREDRVNRDVELAELSDKLKIVRNVVGLADDAALDAAAPPPEAIAAVQRLAAQGLERRGKIASLGEERAREIRTLDSIAARQGQRRAAFAHEPFGILAADFANLAAVIGVAETKARQAAQTMATIDAGLVRHRFADIDALSAWSCPDAAVIQSEIDRRGVIMAEQARVLDRIAGETERHDNAVAEIERSLAGEEPPSDVAIARTRAERDRLWDEIKARYLSPDGEAVRARPISDRLAEVELKQRHTRHADDLADRKSVEAGRVAALDRALREKSASAAALAALMHQQAGLDGQLAAAIIAWNAAWPDVAERDLELGNLKALTAGRDALLTQCAVWRSEIEDAEAQAASIAPRLAALAEAEARLGLAADGTLTARIIAATRAIKKHDDAYADYRQDESALCDIELKVRGIDEALALLMRSDAEWRGLWAPAARALGLSEPVALERANEIATQWATATGLLDGVRTTRRRLQRMDEDEAALRAAVSAIAGSVGFPLPDDAVAAARMLAERLEAARGIRIERESLNQQLIALSVERDQKSGEADIARAALAGLCREATCEQSALAALAERCRARTAMSDRLTSLAETIAQLGDGLSVEVLREQWADRDLDVITARSRQLEGEAVGLIDLVEAARGALQDRTRDLTTLSAAAGVNVAVAERERATAEIHGVLERYIELALAEELLRAAMDRVREQQKDPLLARAGALFAEATAGAFAGIETEIDGKGLPVVVGRRASSERVPVAIMSDGVRDQLFLSFRIASIEQYCRAAEPLPFIADDLLVHFDDDRGVAALGLLAELGKTTQVLVFTHHRHVRDAASVLVADNRAAVIELSTV